MKRVVNKTSITPVHLLKSRTVILKICGSIFLLLMHSIEGCFNTPNLILHIREISSVFAILKKDFF